MLTNGTVAASEYQKKSSSNKRGRENDDKILEDLATELFGVIAAALKRFGVSRRVQKKAFTRCCTSRKLPRASGAVLRDLNCLGELTLAWKTESAYIDGEGLPRVLDLYGAKGTFEALSRRFFHKKTLQSVVNLACQHADVTATKSGRIALLGSSVVNTNVASSTPRAVAQLVRQIDQLVLTSAHNYAVARGAKGSRRFERMCHAVISRSQFESIMQELRPQMHDLLERADSLFRERATSRTSRRNLCVANVGIYVSRCDDVERVGYDASGISKRLTRGASRPSVDPSS